MRSYITSIVPFVRLLNENKYLSNSPFIEPRVSHTVNVMHDSPICDFVVQVNLTLALRCSLDPNAVWLFYAHTFEEAEDFWRK